VLNLAAQREMRPEQERLVEIEPDAAIERRPADMRAGGPGRAEEVHMMVLGVDARLFFSAPADAEVDPLMLPFGYGDFCRDLRRLLLRVQWFNVGELEQLHAV